MNENLVYVGKIASIEKIENADFIVSATVICGQGGKWKGVVKKDQFSENDACILFLPDSILPENDAYRFMEKNKWRVKMCRFRGVPSEVLIMPYHGSEIIGTDLTEEYGVRKYFKPVPANLQGKAKGEFPNFIPKTDEPNFQAVPQLLEMMKGIPYYITEKIDGSSTTAYKYKGEFGVCSRNWEIERDENIGYWTLAIKHKLEERLPEGYALQWETCGPKIQNNPLGLTEIAGYAFSAYRIDEKRFLTYEEFTKLCKDIEFPHAKIVKEGDSFDEDKLQELAEGKYEFSKKDREGIVIRSQINSIGHKPISFKVINLNYE